MKINVNLSKYKGLRKISMLLISQLLYNNVPLKEKFCHVMNIPTMPGRVHLLSCLRLPSILNYVPPAAGIKILSLSICPKISRRSTVSSNSPSLIVKKYRFRLKTVSFLVHQLRTETGTPIEIGIPYLNAPAGCSN